MAVEPYSYRLTVEVHQFLTINHRKQSHAHTYTPTRYCINFTSLRISSSEGIAQCIVYVSERERERMMWIGSEQTAVGDLGKGEINSKEVLW